MTEHAQERLDEKQGRLEEQLEKLHVSITHRLEAIQMLAADLLRETREQDDLLCEVRVLQRRLAE